jgi:hypothetical protein
MNLATRIRVWDGTYYAEVDSLGYLVGIDIGHHKIHEGYGFFCSDADTDVDIAGPKYWRLTTPNSAARIHIKLSVSASNAGKIELFENPTIDAAGDALTEYNCDRNSATSTTLAVFKDTTFTADGTLLSTVFVGSSSGPTRLGGNTRSEFELILKQNEDYALKVTVDNNDTKVAFISEWYEIPAA